LSKCSLIDIIMYLIDYVVNLTTRDLSKCSLIDIIMYLIDYVVNLITNPPLWQTDVSL
jgi:hypothetical protein